MKNEWHHTTVLAVRRNGVVAVGSDGQVTLGSNVIKQGAAKVRRLAGGKVVAGFAGSVADALAPRLLAALGFGTPDQSATSTWRQDVSSM